MNNMANTYSALFYHIVFSTKGRKRWITPDIEDRVWAYIGGVARAHGLIAIQVGGIEDHIHVLIMAKPIHSPSEIAKWLKGETSKWIHTEFDNMRSFQWQDGDGGFRVTKVKVPAVVEYIKGQRDHHSSEAFEDEYERMLERHGVEFDPQYLLG